MGNISSQKKMNLDVRGEGFILRRQPQTDTNRDRFTPVAKWATSSIGRAYA